MQLRHVRTLHQPSEPINNQFNKLTHSSYAPSQLRFAVAQSDRAILIFDDTATQRDKFPTKPADKDKSKNSYTIRALAFNTDGTKLAVGQSDNIVFVYKLGHTFTEKKTICNKYIVNAAVTALVWPNNRDIIFATADGKVRAGNSANKTSTLYSTDIYVVSLVASSDGAVVISGHIDGSVNRYVFGAPAHTQLTHVPFVPQCVGYTPTHVIIAGNSPIIRIVDVHTGANVGNIDYSKQKNIKEFTSMAVHPSGQTFCIGHFNGFMTINYNSTTNSWTEHSQSILPNLYTVTTLAWKPDGSRLFTGSLNGSLDAFDASVRRVVLSDGYECIYTSQSSALVQRSGKGDHNNAVNNNSPVRKVQLKSRFGLEIHSIKVKHDRFVIAKTSRTLLCGDAVRGVSSEIEWSGGGGKERYFFDCDSALLAHHNGEMHVIEYGVNDTTAIVRIDRINPHLFSVRINEARSKHEGNIKRMAYQLDSHTVRIISLDKNATLNQTVNHHSRIDWLELNQRGNKLLFRDKKHALILYDCVTAQRMTLLTFCSYVQWVPDSDVIIAQSRRQCCVWYSVDRINDVCSIPIKGDIQEITRTVGSTIVHIDEGSHVTQLPLNETLIAFASAIDGHQWYQATVILESIQDGSGNAANSDNVRAMWSQLAAVALEEDEYLIAERCYAALGNSSRAAYLHAINAVLDRVGGDKSHYAVRSLVCMLHGEWKRAEQLLLAHGCLHECILMYRGMYKWEDALALAEQRSYPQINQLRTDYFTYLMESQQEELAGKLKEREEDYDAALNLYLKGGYPARAADLILKRGLMHNTGMCDRVIASLTSAHLYEKLGDFCRSLNQHKPAFDAYLKGHVYHAALDIARQHFPSQVVGLESAWGDWLFANKQFDAASNHFIQSGNSSKALSAAIAAQSWSKAHQIIEQMDVSESREFAPRLAAYFSSTNNYVLAEKYYLISEEINDCVMMYTNAGLWEKAHAIAKSHMSNDELNELYTNAALKYEANHKWREAEKLYVTINAIEPLMSMYRKHRLYDDLIRVVGLYRKELLTETQLQLAALLQAEGNLKQAESLYVAAKDWKKAVEMYKDADQWEELLRVAKAHGGMPAYKQWAYQFALSVGGEAGMKMLIKRNLGELAVDVAVERGEFNQAFALAERTCKAKLPEVHLHYAMALEDEGRFAKAEEEFIIAKKPKEAIDMYLHQHEWDQAIRVAEQNEPSAINDIHEAHAKACTAEKAYPQAEQLFLSGKKPEFAVKMYVEAGLFDDALRVAKQHAPRMIKDIQTQRSTRAVQQSTQDSVDYILNAAKLAVQKQQWSSAVDSYLKLNSSHIKDSTALQRQWENAVSIAMDHLPARISEVIQTVSQRLCELQRYEAAAELLLQTDSFKQAIDALIQGKLYDKARQLAQTEAPQLVAYVNQSHSQSLAAGKQLSALAAVNPDMAIDAYAQSGQWDRVYELATKSGDDMVHRYALIQVNSLVKESQYHSALTVLLDRNVPVVANQVALYKRIATELLTSAGQCESEHDGHGHVSECIGAKRIDDYAIQTFTQLNKLLKQVLATLNTSSTAEQQTDLLQLSFIVQIICNRYMALQSDIPSIFTKTSVSLLRYTTYIPVDKAFHDAGIACRDIGWYGSAFVFLNRFIDLCDVMSNPDSGDIDNTDFLETDLPTPFTIPLPKHQYYLEEVREDAREWVLDKAMSADNSQCVSKRKCESCSRDMYEAALVCHHCQHTYPLCIVTGYPVFKTSLITCKSCQRPANKEDWNKYVAKCKACPACQNVANPLY